MSKENFVWTDDKVADFVFYFELKEKMNGEMPTGIYTEMRTFQSSRQERTKPPLGVTPDYIHKEQRLEDIRQAMNRFNDYHKGKMQCPKEWLDEKHELEDWLRKRKEGKVKFFPERTKLFTTEDGVDIFEGDVYYYVNMLFQIHPITASGGRKWDRNLMLSEKIYSTPEKAKEYVKFNKPCLSIMEMASCATNYVKKNPPYGPDQQTLVLDVIKVDALIQSKLKEK